jgi:hypothetical protein
MSFKSRVSAAIAALRETKTQTEEVEALKARIAELETHLNALLKAIESITGVTKVDAPQPQPQDAEADDSRRHRAG